MSRIDPIELFITELARGARQRTDRQKRRPERAAQARLAPGKRKPQGEEIEHMGKRTARVDLG
jgi:hypothetical protein